MYFEFNLQFREMFFLQSVAHFHTWEMVRHKLIDQQLMEDTLKTPQQILPVMIITQSMDTTKVLVRLDPGHGIHLFQHVC